MGPRRADSSRPAPPGRATAWLAPVVAAAAILLLPGTAEGAAGVKLDAPPAKAKATSLVTFKGRAGPASGGRVTIQRRAGRRWKPIARGRTAKRGRFALTWITPSRGSRVAVRAVLGNGSRRTSRIRRLTVRAPARGAARVIVSKRTRIISPSAIESVPAPGQPGRLAYAGGNDTEKGQIIVIGRGEETPEGFLGRVTGVERSSGETVVSTVPAQLQDAVPEGSMRLVAATVKTARARTAQRARITCVGSAGVSIEHDVTFSAGLVLDGSWTFLGGLQSASVSANASLNASLKAVAAAAGSCSLPQTTLLRVKGPGVSGFVGPVPIVLTSTLTVYLDASAAAKAELSTGASAGFDASAGVAWKKGAGFSPTQSFTPKFGFDPPSITASASVAANLTPTVDVELYGLAGPRVALRTGVEFAADSASDPWWTLTVPVDLTASVAIRPLGLVSPELHVYQRDFTIADAGGPFRQPGAEPPPPGPLKNEATPASSLGAGYDQSCGLRASGAVACWGGNGNGQLGNGKTTGSSTPVPVSALGDAAGISGGSRHTCALRVAGEVSCWGENDSGKLGNGTNTGSTTPVPVSGMKTATAVAAGGVHSCALLANRRVSCWGGNSDRPLGYGATSSNVPREVPGLVNATTIAANENHSCARRSSGEVGCWGRNGEMGRFGNGPNADSTNGPVNASGITNAIGVSLGVDHTCAVLSTGEVKCWGAGFYGQLGNGSTASSTTPVTVSGITDATAVTSGAAHNCAQLSSGAIKCWGWNNYGQVGDGTTQDRLRPVQVSGSTDATAVVAGFQHSCALRGNGAMACWGYGVDGQLGDGANSNRFTPVPVTGFP